MSLPRAGGRGVARAALGAALCVVCPAALAAQDARAASSTGAIAGRVTVRGDTGAAAPAVSAAVTVAWPAAAPRTTTTGADGRFVVGGVPAGPATVRVRLAGQRAAEQAVRVRAGDTARVEIVLHPDAQRLAAIRTDARPADAEAFAARPDVATVTLGAAAMAGVPRVGEPDVVRVAQLLPGVVARNDFTTGLNVRGGEADQNLVLLDGHPIHNPFHLGGLFSTFMDATVGGMELVTGAFPARHGGRLSSVLDVRSADDARPGVHATADVSALATTGRLAGALDGGRGTWSVAARRTYADALASIFTRNVFPYHFRDLHARATHELPGGVRVALTAYAGKDVLDANLAEIEGDPRAAAGAGEGTWAFEWGNQVLGLTLAKDLGARTTVEQRVSTSGFATRTDLGQGATGQQSRVRDVRLAGSIATRGALGSAFGGAAHDVAAGYEVASHHFRYASGSTATGTSDFDIEQRPTTGALWIEDLWRVSPRWLVQGGVRAEALSGRRWAGLSPRASVKHLVTPTLALTAGAGRVTQWMHSLAGDGPLRYFDVWLASDAHTPVASAWQYVAGAERRVRDAGSVRVEGYVKRYDRVMEANWSEDPGRRGDELLAAAGTSYGVDVHARWQPAHGPAGWIAYSYGVSRRWRDGVRWAPGHDRRHDVDVVATWQLTRYRLGARFGWASGTPFTPMVGEIVRRVYDPSRDRWGTGEPRLFVEPLGGPRHGARFPATHRLDLDVSRDLRLRGATVTPYASVANAYNAPNVFVYLYEYSNDHPSRRAISQFPILPSAGVRVAW